ncbi:MAG: AAA family ATPase [Chloroflexota bacterium]
MMLSFEKLIQETTQTLAPTNPAITETLVRDVLTDAGIDDSLRDTAPTPQGRLIVHGVTIIGQKVNGDGVLEPFQYQRKLGTGLWAWVGSNGTGKSTILNCILWAITGSDSGIPKRIRPWLHDILVEFSVGEAQFTSHIIRANDGVTGGIYHGFVGLNMIDLGTAQPFTLFATRDEMREAIDLFFMQQLGITTLRWTAHSGEKDDPDLHAHSTTWRTYAHAIHIDDDSYDHLIIDPMKGYGRQDRKILEMMLGIEQSRTVAEIQVQADFAKEAYGRARSRVSGKRSNVTDQIAALEQESRQVQQALATVEVPQTPVESDNSFVALRERRAATLAEQNQLIEEIAALDAQQAGLERNMLEVEREKVALREQGEVEYLVNSLVVTRCPHCESAVNDQQRMATEKQQQTCHVCSQPIQRARIQGDIRTILRERDQDLASLRAVLKRVQQDIVDRENRLDVGQDEAARLGRELETNVKQAREGFSTTYANLLVRKGQIDGQLEQLRRSLAEMDAEQNEVETAARWHLILQTAAEIADESVFAVYENAFAQLGDLVVQLATQFGVPDLEKVIIDEKRYVKLYQGGMQIGHNDLARSERVKFKVAFHLALMLLQVRNGLGRHPDFLIIDTPGTAEIDEADLVAMTKDLARIHTEYGGVVQIIVATARPEALQNLPPELTATAMNGAFF